MIIATYQISMHKTIFILSTLIFVTTSGEGAFSSLSMLDRHQRLKNGDLSDNCFSKLTKPYLISAND
ncbi:hypothetical protein T05_7608 [Trichinella murrelli]|uniref:Uncharacterized protein n=1 Tax=Trichinella murrelli TaxID=144512 RepID=A0A0V0TIL5_9BILA|nr:hypothetical protein T05_7608 [Trichinella murrelli]